MTRAENEALLGTHFTLSKRVHQFGRDKLGSERKRFSKVHFHVGCTLDGASGGGGGGDNGCFITDLSAWGTYVDGAKLPFKQQAPLRLGSG